MPAALELNTNQLKKLLLQCDPKEKDMFIDLLLKDTRERRIKHFFNDQADLDIPMDEIVNEVKAARRAKRG